LLPIPVGVGTYLWWRRQSWTPTTPTTPSNPEASSAATVEVS
jgi:hypothetical protein